MNCLHWDVGPFLKMENPQVIYINGTTLETFISVYGGIIILEYGNIMREQLQRDLY